MIKLLFLLKLSSCFLLISHAVAQGDCNSGARYDVQEMAESSFYSNRELTKFASGRRHFPLPNQNSARYCYSRGCAKQLNVYWSQAEIDTLKKLRSQMVVNSNDPHKELRFIKVAVLQMENWLRDKALAHFKWRQGHNIAHESESSGEMAWVKKALASYSPMDKECVTYTMEASQHLMVLANLGLLKNWNVKPPEYRFGIPGHWTAALQNRDTCRVFRFDLNTRASTRESLMRQGENPALMLLRQPQRFGNIAPGMDYSGYASHRGAIGSSPNVYETSAARPARKTRAKRRDERQPFNTRTFFEQHALSAQ